MSDKPDNKAAAGGAPGAPAKEGEGKKSSAGGVLKSTPVLFGMVMVTEAAVLFAGFKFLGSGARPAHAELSTSEASEAGAGGEQGGTRIDRKKLVELSVLEFKAPNKQTGRTFLYDVHLYISAKAEHKERLEQTIKDREATIKDRVRTIIAQSDPEKLGGGVEPGLETLRRQVKFQLDELLGEGLIEEVLIPRCIPYRTEF